MEEMTKLNFAIPSELSLKIDRMLIDLKEKGHISKKNKPELLADLLREGYNAKMKEL